MVGILFFNNALLSVGHGLCVVMFEKMETSRKCLLNLKKFMVAMIIFACKTKPKIIADGSSSVQSVGTRHGLLIIRF